MSGVWVLFSSWFFGSVFIRREGGLEIVLQDMAHSSESPDYAVAVSLSGNEISLEIAVEGLRFLKVATDGKKLLAAHRTAALAQTRKRLLGMRSGFS